MQLSTATLGSENATRTFSVTDAQWLQAGIGRLRMEAFALQQQSHQLLDAFGRTALEVDGLYHKAHHELESAAENLQLATRLCGAINSCAECAKASICGWCVNENHCAPGDALGTYQGVQLQCSTYRFGKCGL